MERVGLSERETVEAVDSVGLTQLAAGEEMSVQGFAIEPGASVPEHDHPHEQAGFLCEGELVFLVDGEEILVAAGGSYVLEGDEPHAVENRGDVTARGVDIFAPPRPNPDWGE